MKIHWVRKHLYDVIPNEYKWYYDWKAACGFRGCLNHTVIRKNVTCKKCLKIMQQKGLK